MQRNPRRCLWLFLFFLQIFSGTSSRAAITVVSYWRLGENDPGATNGVTATNTVDIAGTNNLQFHGTAQYTNDVAAIAANHTGSSLSINFTNGAYAINPLILTNVDNFGVECWVKPMALGSGQVIVYNGATGGTGDGGWGIILNPAGMYQVLFGGLTAFGTAAAGINTWTHVAAVRASGVTTLYVNGAVSDTNGTMPAVSKVGGFALGAPPQTPTSQYFTGLIDEVRVFTFASGQFTTNDLLWNADLLPALSPLAAANITAGSATLETLVNPNGSPTTAWFAFGTDTSYGQTNFIPNVGSGNSSVLVTNNLSGLVPGTQYHFLAGASNSFGVTTGLDQTFLAVNPPGVTTLPATSITGSGATLNGTVQVNGVDTTAWFQYGATTNYGSNTPPTTIPGTAPATFLISNSVSGLSVGVTCHFRLVGTNVSSAAFGADAVFTPSLPPAINSEGVTGLTTTNATLNATVTSMGADTGVFFEFGPTSSYGNTNGPAMISGTNSSPAPFAIIINNLSAGETYHYQIVATNVSGVTSSGDLTFTTPSFAPVATTPTAFYWSALAWGDFDNDGLLDVVIVGVNGNPDTEVWHNNGDGTFSNLNVNITGVTSGSVAVGDYDNDGRLDILISGQNSAYQPVTEVWRNTGHGFTNINAGLHGVEYGSAAWGDYDNDGRLDILLSGYYIYYTNASYYFYEPVTEVWRNTGSGFSNINAVLPGVFNSSVAWGDYDNDGRLDILLSGEDIYYLGTNTFDIPITQVWRNTGNGFTNINAGLTGVKFGSVAWGDYDNDGRLDILLSGQDLQSNQVTEVWRNTGNGFTNINAGLPGGISYSSVAWGDYDNDGKLDILLSGGNSDSNLDFAVWRNTGNGFVNIDTGLTGLYFGPTAWGDFNNDGRLDCLLPGYDTNTNFITLLLQNETPTSNSPPTAPTGLSATFTNSTFTLYWQPSSDAQTPAAGLSYNVRIGTTPGGSDILAPVADTNGMRLVPQRGNIQPTRFTLQLPSRPPAGISLYWSVQSIDTSFAGSPFAPEASFVVPPLPPPPPVLPFFTSSGLTSDGTFEAQFNVVSGTNYTIQASTDLVHWVDLFNFTFGSSGPFQFTDPDTTNYPQRFYRFGQH